MTSGGAALTLVERAEPHGRVRLALEDHSNGFARDASSLTIDPIVMYDGCGASLVARGIGNVETCPQSRRQGLATRLINTAIERMRTGGVEASLLYGIDQFYEPFGWRDCGDERWVHIQLTGDVMTRPAQAGYAARAAKLSDLPALARCYELVASRIPGALTRPVDGRAWERITSAELRVVERDGAIVGWIWRGRGALQTRDDLAAKEPAASVFAELHAIDDDAMRAAVAEARSWARDAPDEPSRVRLVVGAPESHPLRRLARQGQLACRLEDELRPRGGAMLLPLGPRAAGLTGSLYQFVPDRF